ncbi:hypothetical protein [Staphylococcus nepalensis]|uniref:hypothetical protein n=1 Tax=Staphylococcus nepalensis TaxID=214473 RepID=UPI001E459085|nr:hypothetical protein [Staphylococcus nepalensis]
MARGFKEQNKIAWNEGKYKKSLSDSELKVFKSLSRNQKDTVVLQYLKNEPLDLLNENSIDLINKITYQETGEVVKSKDEVTEKKENKKKEKIKSTELKQDKIKKANYDRLIKFFVTQGIYNPSQTTMDAFTKQNIMANFDKFYHALGTFTLNMEKQAMYNYYQTQQNQNFIQIAQNDTLIKQNDEIIELLKTIANK